MAETEVYKELEVAKEAYKGLVVEKAVVMAAYMAESKVVCKVVKLEVVVAVLLWKVACKEVVLEVEKVATEAYKAAKKVSQTESMA